MDNFSSIPPYIFLSNVGFLVYAQYDQSLHICRKYYKFYQPLTWHLCLVYIFYILHFSYIRYYWCKTSYKCLEILWAKRFRSLYKILFMTQPINTDHFCTVNNTQRPQCSFLLICFRWFIHYSIFIKCFLLWNTVNGNLGGSLFDVLFPAFLYIP